MSPARRLDAELAVRAATALEELRGNGKLPTEVVGRLRELPVMIRQAGLVTTMAYFAAKRSDRALGHAYAVVLDELRGVARPYLPQPAPNDNRFFQSLAQVPPIDLARATATASAYADWLSRLAEAVKSDEEPVGAREEVTGADHEQPGE